MGEPERKVEGMYKDSFRDVLHRLVEQLDREEVEDGVIAFTVRNEAGGVSVFRQSFGNPTMSLGLLNYIRSFIESEMGSDF